MISNTTVKFKEYLKANNITVYKAEKDLNLSNGFLGKAFKANNGFKADIIEKILKTYKIDRSWLLGTEKKGGPKEEITKSIDYLRQELMVKDLQIQHLQQMNSLLKDEIEYIKQILAPKINIKPKQRT